MEQTPLNRVRALITPDEHNISPIRVLMLDKVVRFSRCDCWNSDRMCPTCDQLTRDIEALIRNALSD